MTPTCRMERSFLLVLACLLVGPAAGLLPGQERKPTPPFTGKTLPVPPRQKQPWKEPSTTLPRVFVRASESLFEAGLADPRGCPYREIEVGTGSCWSGDAGVVPTHGWVLPSHRGEKQRFAVCWNGLVYPVVSVGKPADFQADVRALLKADQEVRARAGEDFYRFRNAYPEAMSVSHRTLLPVKACLLLRLGKVGLAQEVWKAWVAGMKEDTNDDAVHLRDPYLMLATDWVWARFDRAVCAHMRGDDRLALLDARALTRIHQAVEKEAARHDFPRNEVPGQVEKPPYLNFLDQLPDLLRDQERRARKKPTAKVPADADRARRIAALIDQLDEVAARQWGQPGGVNLAFDPTVQALIKEGDAAVEPLLTCLEEDTRLTRSVHFWRDFSRHRSLLGVHEAAYVALVGILDTSFFGVASTGDNLTSRGLEGRKKVASAIRAYWNRFGALPPEERWYLILSDDRASPGHWMQAAGNIVQPVDVFLTRGSTFGSNLVTIPEREKGERPRLRGEKLRNKKNPSVTELFIRRINILSRSGKPGSEWLYRMGDACRLVDYLVDWDPHSALPVLRKQVQRCRDYLAREGKDSDSFGILGPAIARFTRARLKAGDDRALDDYAEWIQTVGPKSASHSFTKVLRPMWEHPTHPAIRAAARALFTAPSPWTRRFLRAFNTHELAITPLVGVAGFRDRLLVELTDRRRAGKMTLNEQGIGWPEVEGAYSGGSGVHSRGDPLAPKPGVESIFRVCDFYAWQLSKLEGAPRCELYWPEKARDQGVAACIAFVKKYGERFQYAPAIRELPDKRSEDQARMLFPVRNRPATAEEVSEGQAIFALAQGKKVRVSRGLRLPIKARWTKYSGAVRFVQTWDSKQNRAVYQAMPDQDGLVWQAEEVEEEGQWQRYYGFVGRHVVAKVPAAEIEFPSPEQGWAELSDGIDCWVSQPGREEKGGMVSETRLGVGGPVPIRVRLRNRSGLERTVPARFLDRDAKGGPGLHAGIELRLRHAKTAGRDQAWTEVPRTPRGAFAAKSSSKTAEPAEVFAEFSLNLNDWFALTEPGAYRFQLIFGRGDHRFAQGESREISFSLGKKGK
jgi:hypothetical protein